MLLEGKAGPRKTSQGTTAELRLGPHADLITSEIGLGKYFEAARFGSIYTTYVKTVTVAATHNSPIAAATATPVIGILNPFNNNKAMVLLRVACGTTSGTPAGGQFVLNYIPGVNQTITATATGNVYSNLLTAVTSGVGTTMRFYNNVALTGLSPAASNEVMLLGQAAAAAAAGNGGVNAGGEDLGGMIIVPPNTLFAIMAGNGAGTSWIVNASVTYAEVDYPHIAT